MKNDEANLRYLFKPYDKSAIMPRSEYGTRIEFWKGFPSIREALDEIFAMSFSISQSISDYVGKLPDTDGEKILRYIVKECSETNESDYPAPNAMIGEIKMGKIFNNPSFPDEKITVFSYCTGGGCAGFTLIPIAKSEKREAIGEDFHQQYLPIGTTVVAIWTVMSHGNESENDAMEYGWSVGSRLTPEQAMAAPERCLEVAGKEICIEPRFLDENNKFNPDTPHWGHGEITATGYYVENWWHSAPQEKQRYEFTWHVSTCVWQFAKEHNITLQDMGWPDKITAYSPEDGTPAEECYCGYTENDG
jgi:hypothetical protein